MLEHKHTTHTRLTHTTTSPPTFSPIVLTINENITKIKQIETIILSSIFGALQSTFQIFQIEYLKHKLHSRN